MVIINIICLWVGFAANIIFVAVTATLNAIVVAPISALGGLLSPAAQFFCRHCESTTRSKRDNFFFFATSSPCGPVARSVATGR